MIFEIAQIEIRPGTEREFEAAVAEAAPLFEGSPGCHSLKLMRSIEHPLRYRLIVGWETIETHMVDFRQSSSFESWRALVGPYFAMPPAVEHVEEAFTGFGN
ncbi:MAG TPA: antibiotic biosynthesis monooxygenase [Allosphingosinicella sp.]